MFQTLFRNVPGKSRRTFMLGVETLEGRNMPSTLSTVVEPASDWPPPPSAVHSADFCLLGGGKFDGSHADSMVVIQRAGEEMPA